MRKRLATLASAVLLANVFLPTGVVFAEESIPVAPVAQVESQGTENAPVLAAVNQDSEGSQEINSVETAEQENATEALVSTAEETQAGQSVEPSSDLLDQLAEELPNQEIPAGIISSLGVNVGGASSSTSTLVKYFTIDIDDEIPLLMKTDGTVDYTATETQYPDTIGWYLNENTQVVDLWWEKVIFTEWLAPLFEKKDSIYRKALKTTKHGFPTLVNDSDAALMGNWTSISWPFSRYAEVKNDEGVLLWYFLLTQEALPNYIFMPVVAKIWNNQFPTIQKAIEASNDGDTILLTRDVFDGWSFYTTAVGAHVCTAGSSDQKTTWPKKITIDFQGHTYNVDDAVGSCGTESQAAHFEKWSEITLKNWTLTSNNANVRMIIQNYAKLTLENFTLDAADLEYLPVYAVSNNFWELNVHGDSHINAGEWGIAFDLWYWGAESYDAGVSVKFASDFVGSVDGDIEYGPANRVKTTPNWEEKALLSIEGNGKFNWTIKASNGNDLKKANITVKWGLFSNDVALYTVSDKCSIKNSDSKYEVKDCPVATKFYGSSNTSYIPVALDGETIKLNETHALMRKVIGVSPEMTTVYNKILEFADTTSLLEIKEVAGEKLLFVNMATALNKQTKVFRAKNDGIFGAEVFKSAGASTATGTITPDLDHAVVPSWVDKNYSIKAYHEVKKNGKVIGYTLQTAKPDYGRFYAPKKYKITFNANGGTAVAPVVQGYGTSVAAPTNPTRSCYRFTGWSPVLPATMPAGDITLTAQWAYACWGGGWGGWGGGSSSSSSLSSSSSSSSSFSAPSTGNRITPVSNFVEKVYSGQVTSPLCSVEGSHFSDEQNQAYLWACWKDITTIRVISGARLDQPLTRAELAKMMSVYVTKILGKQPVVTGTVQYADVDEKLWDLAGYIQLAYQLQIMGINHDGTALSHFEPHKLVTRAEFATVFSRVLYGNKYNQAGENWANGHLEALKSAWILKDTTPMMQEIRGRVLLMLHRSTAK